MTVEVNVPSLETGSVRPGDGVSADRFYMIALMFQRARQLHGGARPRVFKDGHKPIRLAQLEVMAGLISWELMPEPPQRP